MQSTLRRDWTEAIVTLLVILSCMGLIAWFQIPHVRQIQTQSQTASVAELQQQVEAERLRLELLRQTPAVGFDNLMADWVFLNFLQYFGDEPARTKTGYGLSPEFFSVVLQRNPHFLRAYTFLSASSTVYAAEPERAIAIAQAAVQNLEPDFPDSYYVWRQIGIDQLLFVGDAAAARESFIKAAEWANLQGATQSATLSQQTADFLANNPDSKYAQVAAWSMVLTNVLDERTQQRAIAEIQALGGAIVENPDGSISIIPPPED